ncbi:MAG: tyrosine-type recombinase/integrase [Clostridiales bacterium]|nr:tyrosine-type recombinase/integrase [Clostridiales bacterium]
MAVDSNGKKLPEGITQRPDGRYMGRFRSGGERYTVYDMDLKECKKKFANLKYEVEHGLFAKQENITVSGWFDIWIKEYKEPTVKQGTVGVYRDNFNSYIQKPLGKKKLKDIRPEHIQKIYNDLNKKGYSRNTIELVSVVLGGMYKQALKNKIVTENPVPLATLPREKEHKEPRVMTVEEQRIFLEYAKESYLNDLFILALATGMRSGELRGLQWQDIDFKNKVIHVNNTLVYVNNDYILDTPKTQTSRRDIPLIDNAVSILKQQKLKQSENRILLGDKWTNKEGLENLVFTTMTGYPINRDMLKQELNRVIKEIQKDHKEFKHITPHTFRHTLAYTSGMPRVPLWRLLHRLSSVSCLPGL